MTNNILERKIIIIPAYDKRSNIPSKNYGIGSCRIFFAVIGKKGAISISFGTNWYLPSTVKEYKEEGIHMNKLSGGEESFKTKIDLETSSTPIRAESWDYHSKKPKFKGQSKFDCDLIKGGCFCDGSFTKADSYLITLLEKGSEGLFKRLEGDYKIEFGS